MMRLVGVCAALLFAPPLFKSQAGTGVPWIGFGPVATAYVMSVDTTVAFTGHSSLLLQSLPGANETTWIAAQQGLDARAYRGRRVRIRAHIRAYEASAAGMWLVIDGYANRRPANLLSDSLVPELNGTTGWRDVSIVFDVSRRASCIRYGSMLHGTGAIWLDAITFDTVPSQIPTTVQDTGPHVLTQKALLANCRGQIPRPMNLDFEQMP